jgi:hypothetical protein
MVITVQGRTVHRMRLADRRPCGVLPQTLCGQQLGLHKPCTQQQVPGWQLRWSARTCRTASACWCSLASSKRTSSVALTLCNNPVCNPTCACNNTDATQVHLHRAQDTISHGMCMCRFDPAPCSLYMTLPMFLTNPVHAEPCACCSMFRCTETTALRTDSHAVQYPLALIHDWSGHLVFRQTLQPVPGCGVP